MGVDLSRCKCHQRRSHILQRMEWCKASEACELVVDRHITTDLKSILHQQVEVSRCLHRHTSSHSSMHPQENNDVLEVALHINCDLHLVSLGYETINVLLCFSNEQSGTTGGQERTADLFREGRFCLMFCCGSHQGRFPHNGRRGASIALHVFPTFLKVRKAIFRRMKM